MLVVASVLAAPKPQSDIDDEVFVDEQEQESGAEYQQRRFARQAFDDINVDVVEGISNDLRIYSKSF